MEKRPDPRVRSVLLTLAGLALAVGGAIMLTIGRALRPKDPRDEMPSRDPDSDRF